MNVVPCGYRVLIEPEVVEEVSAGGIIFAKDIVKQEQTAQVKGKVLDIGGDCWREFNAPWAKIGDTVLYQRYSGMKVPDGKGGFLDNRLLLNDTEITAVVIEDK